MSTATEPQDAFALGRSNLNGFLFADIGVEGSGMPLSVISALARQGLDPWLEAGRLAKLPRTVAADGLARLIAALPASLWPMPDATLIAARLVTLLPGQDGLDGASQTRCAGGEARQFGPWLIAAVVLGAALAVGSAYLAPAPAGPVVPLATQPAPAHSVPADG